MLSLIRRNLLLYFRNISDVILSVLSVVIAIGVYVLFLSKLQIDMVNGTVKNLNVSHKDILWLVNSWVLAGLLAITPVTSGLGGLGTLVHDMDKKITKDFKSSPVGKWKYPLSVLISSCIIGSVMSFLPLIIYSIYIYVATGHAFSISQYVKVCLMILYTSFFSCSVMGVITSLLKSRQAFTSLSIIAGTIIGFLEGVYMPIGMLPNKVQDVLKVIPFGHCAVVFRSILMSNSIDGVMGKVPESLQREYLECYGVKYYVDDSILSIRLSIFYMLMWAIVALVLYLIRSNRKAQKY